MATQKRKSHKSRILAELKNRSLSTSEIIFELKIMNPAQRIKDLRNDGHDIITTLSATSKEARYVLKVSVESA